MRGLAASLTAFIGELREVDLVLGRARSSAATLSLLDGTLVAEPGPAADLVAWDGYGRIAGLVAEARRREAAAEHAWTEALWRYDLGSDPAPLPAARPPGRPAHRSPPFGAFPGEHAVPTPRPTPRPARARHRPQPTRPDRTTRAARATRPTPRRP